MTIIIYIFENSCDVCLFKFNSSFMVMTEQISTDSYVIDSRVIRKFRSKLYKRNEKIAAM